MHRQHARTLTALSAVALVFGCSRAPETDPKLVSEWMHTLYGAIRVERLSPPVASRVMAYATAALYSGLVASDRQLAPLQGVLNGFPELPATQGRVDGALAAIAAERVVLDSLFREALPTTRTAIARLADSLSNARAALGISSSTRAASEEHGKHIGLAVVRWSRTDGFDSTRLRPPYVAPTGVAYWVNDAPATTYAQQNLSGASDFVALGNPANILQSGNSSERGLVLNRPKRPTKTLPPVNMAGTSEPYWGQVRPFVLKTWNECAVPEPPAYSPDSVSALYRDAKQLHAMKDGITPEQRAIAFYWADNAGESGTPVGHWFSIASQMVSQRKLTAAQAARMMVLTAAAQADAFISSWGYKYQYALIRPRTYIRRVIDPAWEPLIPTPPFPEYPSGHSTQSAAAATVLASLLGDSVAFDDSTGLSIGNSVRRFKSFREAADEAGMSRLYGGIHFMYGNLGGQSLGRCVGDKVVERSNLARTQ